jgi:hypothetical protein
MLWHKLCRWAATKVHVMLYHPYCELFLAPWYALRRSSACRPLPLFDPLRAPNDPLSVPGSAPLIGPLIGP